ncbi:MAG TPA: translesion error-prone DNA polymerase V autoproteolytic subunit [Anaerohalosphaeraceae bacterium]|nr:translesion error-prone DNA polymerase V autoproteolytic subunit [Phycisphaerae bacterium]HOK96529.1 translesion error-prone DNA polymerase V autoproteolytic subunit [Anaerohalosphaeraceae bacterium]HOL32241.1 translesion error-prone DNA polymerase V autoproteolytic subunit [Anaerohalosphaeraceae bacterium]HOM76405.1 translesion error-prone DNA polymerase V autoproteolytic subunit [Anaerohalosphaeraceae bacterium]HPC63673.1 translesion error-prone DNA polymerase V autoproteolytic subunit [An
MKAKVSAIYRSDISTAYRQPYFEAKVPAGFPSPAADYEENQLDLNKHLIKNPAATFFVRVSGDSMTGAGIHDGDLLVVDRSLEPKDKNVVIAAVNGELTVKRIRIRKKKVFLEAANEKYAPRQISDQTDFQVWGVVTSVIHPV